ncbi:MAG TPA: helix-turn-helix domain-containing protein [Caulobacteraceae bacterium]
MDPERIVATRIRRLREAKDMSRRELAAALKVDVTALAGWESGKYLPRIGHRGQLASILGTDIKRLFEDAIEPDGDQPGATLFDTIAELEPLLARLIADTRSCLRALRIAAPYSTPAHVQKTFRTTVANRLLTGDIEVHRVEIFYELSRLKEVLSNIIRYDGCRYYVKSYCAGSTEIVPGMGGYFFDDSEFLIGAYWTGVPPHHRPGLRLSGEPFRTYFNDYWNEIWRRGTLLNIRGMHDLTLVRDLAMKMGLPPTDWPRFLREARALDIGDGAPPLV